MVDAHAALIEAYQPISTKDRREAETHDLLQTVLFEGNIVEVQFHFDSPVRLKKLSHAAYNIQRVDTSDLDGIRALARFPAGPVAAFRDRASEVVQKALKF